MNAARPGTLFTTPTWKYHAITKPTLYVFKLHSGTEEVVHALGKSGFEVTKLSVIGRGYHTEEKLMGFYTKGDRIKCWGTAGAFCGGISALVAALTQSRAPKDKALKYEAALTVDEYLSIVHSTAEDAVKVSSVQGEGESLETAWMPRHQRGRPGHRKCNLLCGRSAPAAPADATGRCTECHGAGMNVTISGCPRSRRAKATR